MPPFRVPGYKVVSDWGALICTAQISKLHHNLGALYDFKFHKCGVGAGLAQ